MKQHELGNALLGVSLLVYLARDQHVECLRDGGHLLIRCYCWVEYVGNGLSLLGVVPGLDYIEGSAWTIIQGNLDRRSWIPRRIEIQLEILVQFLIICSITGERLNHHSGVSEVVDCQICGICPKSVSHAQALELELGRGLAELLRGGHRLEQLALAEFMAGGQFARHLGRMRRLYRERQQALRTALQAHLPELAVQGGDSGLHLTLQLPPACPDGAVSTAARAAGMNVGAVSSFSEGQAQGCHNGLVIGYGNTSAEQFGPLIRRLAVIVRRSLRTQSVAG